MQKLLIATTIKAKWKKSKIYSKISTSNWSPPINIGLKLEVKEDGNTYAENAEKKAVAFARASRLISLADDSGLEVDALDGAPRALLQPLFIQAECHRCRTTRISFGQFTQ